MKIHNIIIDTNSIQRGFEIRFCMKTLDIFHLPEQTSTVLQAGPFQVHREYNHKVYHCISVCSYQPAVQQIQSMDWCRKSAKIHPMKRPNLISLAVRSSTFGMLVEFYPPFLAYLSIGLMLFAIESLRSTERPYCIRFVPVAC